MKRKYIIILCMVIVVVFFSIVLGEGIHPKTADSSGRRTFELPIWHPDACWDGKPVTVVGSGALGQLA